MNNCMWKLGSSFELLYLHHSFGLFNEYKQHNCSVSTDIVLIPAKFLTAQYRGSAVLSHANVKAMYPS